MEKNLVIKAIATAITEENQNNFEHFAKAGTCNISIEYNYKEGPEENGLEDEYYAGLIDVYSDGYISCDIFDEDYASAIIGDYLVISGEQEKPNGISWHSDKMDVTRWPRTKDFLKNKGIELKYSEDILFERELQNGEFFDEKSDLPDFSERTDCSSSYVLGKVIR